MGEQPAAHLAFQERAAHDQARQAGVNLRGLPAMQNPPHVFTHVTRLPAQRYDLLGQTREELLQDLPAGAKDPMDGRP